MFLPHPEFLRQLLDTPTPSGFEAAGQKCWMAHLRQFADSVESDAYGTAWATRLGQKTRPILMIEAHMDEIGMMVQYITSEGFLTVTPIGGSDRVQARGKRVEILGSKGMVEGVIGWPALHLRRGGDEKMPEWHELHVDVGAASREEVLARGVRVGTPMTYAGDLRELSGNRLISRAMDNKISAYILSEVIRRLSLREERQAVTVIAVNAVQEEIGGHGAQMVTHRLRPDFAIVLDVTHATDSPGIDKNRHGEVRLGGGPTLTHGTANHPGLVKRIEDIAVEKGVAIQHEASSRNTGTDTDNIYVSREGIPSALMSIPLRYMHSTVETVDANDVESAIQLLYTLAESLSHAERFRTHEATTN